MIESCFHGVVRAKAIGTSGDHSDFVVEAFDRAVGDFTFGLEPIEDEFLVGAEHAGDLAHGLEAAAKGTLAPDIQEGGRPSEGTVAPEVLEGFLEHPRSGGGQFGVQEAVEFLLGSAADAAAAAQQCPAHVLELGGLGTTAQSVALGAAHLVNGLVEVRGDVKAVEDVERVTRLGGDDLEVGLPHVAADKTQAADDFRSEGGQPPAQGRLGAARPNPKQTAAVAVDLIDDGQEVLRTQSLAPVNLVDADGFDSFQFAMRQTPLDKPIHGAVDGLPTGLEGPSRFTPRQPACPAGQEDHHREGHRTFARAPGNVFDADAVLGAVYAAWRVEETRRDSPQRHEMPEPFRQSIVARSGEQALSTLAVHGGVRLAVDVDAQAGVLAQEANLPVNETGKMLNPVQNGLNGQLNSWSPGQGFAVFNNGKLPETLGDQLFISGFVNRWASCDAADAWAEDRALRGRNLSAVQSLHTAEGPVGWLNPIVRSQPSAGAATKRKIPGGLGDRVPHSTHKFCYRAGILII